MIKISHFFQFQFIIMVLVLTSCFKEDKIILPHDRGDVQTDTIAMTDTYKYQIYFRLDSGVDLNVLRKAGIYC